MLSLSLLADTVPLSDTSSSFLRDKKKVSANGEKEEKLCSISDVCVCVCLLCNILFFQ